MRVLSLQMRDDPLEQEAMVKAVRIHEYGGPEVLVYEEVPTPEPGPKQVLVKVAAATVNPIDVAVREDRFPTPKHPPKIIGSDGAGVVEKVGAEVTAARPGDRVAFSGLGVGSEGSYAEYVLITEAQVVHMPDGLSFTDAAAIGMAFPAAYYALVTRGALREGETVLVQGASGGVGSASVQLAKTLGARVFGTVSGPGAAELVLGLGAEAVIDFRTEDVAARVLELTDGKGVDLVHELVLSENLPTDVKLVAKGGRIVGTGQGPGADAVVPAGEAIGKDVSVLFMNLANAGRAGVAAIAAEIAAMAAAGKVKPVIGAELPLAEARRAHEMLAGDHLGKIVLLP
jgi:NADPH2:quinone reductase